MLSTVDAGQEEPDATVVRDYVAALNTGRFLDALNAFSLDASFRDETGRERHGIREIAAAFAGRARPQKVEIEDIRRQGDGMAVRLRMSDPTGRAPIAYQTMFRIRRNRILSLDIEPVRSLVSAERRITPSA